MASPLIIGITGGSGSGKTYFLKQLAQRLPDEKVSVLSFDNYYQPRHLQPKDENGIENFDTPESLDIDRFAADLQALIKGQNLAIKEYTFNNYKAEPKLIHIKSAPVILIEGIFTFHFQEIFDLLSLKLFIDAPTETMLSRRIHRDAVERGYDLEDVNYRFSKHVMPAFKNFIETKKPQADLIIPNHSGFEKALQVVVVYINNWLKNNSYEQK